MSYSYEGRCDEENEVEIPMEKHEEKSVEQELLESVASFSDALEKGEVTKRFTCRQIKLNLEPTPYNPALVKETRNILGVSQALFARFLGASPKTVRAWEQGLNTPHSMACRFMDEIRRAPQFWKKRLKDVSVQQNDLSGKSG